MPLSTEIEVIMRLSFHSRISLADKQCFRGVLQLFSLNRTLCVYCISQLYRTAESNTQQIYHCPHLGPVRFCIAVRTTQDYPLFNVHRSLLYLASCIGAVQGRVVRAFFGCVGPALYISVTMYDSRKGFLVDDRT